MKDTIWYVIHGILIILGLTLFVIGTVKCSYEVHNKKAWNNGYCECGGRFEYEQAVGHQYSTSYIYICDSCGKHIEIWERG